MKLKINAKSPAALGSSEDASIRPNAELILLNSVLAFDISARNLQAGASMPP